MRLTMELADGLLQDGRSLVQPCREEREAIARLEAEGFIHLTDEPVFRCFDPSDDACFDHPTRACGAWVPVPLDDDRAFCPSCGLDHEGREARTTRQHLEVDWDRVVGWIDARLRLIDPHARRHREGVAWSVAFAERDAVVVWVQDGADVHRVARALATSQPVVFVTARPRMWAKIFREEGGPSPLGVASWLLGGDEVLLAALALAAAGSVGSPEP